MGKHEAEIVEVVDGIPVKRFDRRARGEGVARAPSQSAIPLRTETALAPAKKPSIVPSAKGDRRPAQERVEEAERRDALSVALAQPERRGIAATADASQAGSATARLHEPLGRFVARQWPRDEEWADSMYRAGTAYDEIIRDSLIAMGLSYIGQSGGRDGGEELTPEQAAARKEVALARRKRADETLMRVHARGARVMEALCYDKRDPSPYDDGILRSGLYALADWLRIIDRGINEGR
jgi:hypothetical protein